MKEMFIIALVACALLFDLSFVTDHNKFVVASRKVAVIMFEVLALLAVLILF